MTHRMASTPLDHLRRPRALVLAALAQATAGAREALLHGAGSDQERASDLLVRQSDHGGERERGALARVQRRVTASEEEHQELVLPAASDVRVGERDACPRAHLGQGGEDILPGRLAASAAQPIAIAVGRDRHQPGLRRIRSARAGPRFEGALDRVVHRVLGVREVPGQVESLGQYL